MVVRDMQTVQWLKDIAWYGYIHLHLTSVNMRDSPTDNVMCLDKQINVTFAS